MVLSTKCMLCGFQIRSNGKIAMRGEVFTHFNNTHPLELQKWNELNQEILSITIKENQRRIEKATQLISVPEYLINDF